MSIGVKGNIVNTIYKGSEDTNKIYKGQNVVYEKVSNDVFDYFHIYATGGPAGVVGNIGFSGSETADPQSTLEYSRDGVNWSSLTGAIDLTISYDENTQEPIYDYIFLRGDNPNGLRNGANSPNHIYVNDTTSEQNANVCVSGNIMSLIYYNDFRDKYTIPNDFCFINLFYQDPIYSAEKLRLPAKHLRWGCYKGMFKECSKLVYGPKVLPANNLKTECYYEMFRDCTSLVHPPALPAQNLYSDCYNFMFMNCTSLEIAPVLPAKNIDLAGYYCLFDGCRKLRYVKILTTNQDLLAPSNRLQFWLSGVAPTGTIVHRRSVVLPPGSSGVPEGWTEEYID